MGLAHELKTVLNVQKTRLRISSGTEVYYYVKQLAKQYYYTYGVVAKPSSAATPRSFGSPCLTNKQKNRQLNKS